MNPLLRWPLALVAVLVGAFTGLSDVVLNHTGWAVPAALVTVLVHVVLPWWARLGFAVGVGLVLFRAAAPTPAGDYLLAADVPGYALLGLGAGLLISAMVTVPASRSGRKSGAQRPAT